MNPCGWAVSVWEECSAKCGWFRPHWRCLWFDKSLRKRVCPSDNRNFRLALGPLKKSMMVHILHLHVCLQRRLISRRCKKLATARGQIVQLLDFTQTRTCISYWWKQEPALDRGRAVVRLETWTSCLFGWSWAKGPEELPMQVSRCDWRFAREEDVWMLRSGGELKSLKKWKCVYLYFRVDLM